MVILLEEFLNKCKEGNKVKDIKLIVEFKDKRDTIKTGMKYGHYIENSVWYNDINTEKDDSENITNDDFLFEMENECLNCREDWGDLYIAPMDDLGKIELLFRYNEEIFEVKKITSDEKNIYVWLINIEM